MEQELRRVISNFEEDFHGVDWRSYPIPQLMPREMPHKKIESSARAQSSQTKKIETRLPSSYNIVDDDDKPSKAKIMAQKRL